MKVLKQIKLIVETKRGEKEVNVEMGINWGTAQPIYQFSFMGYSFDKREGNFFRDHEKNVKVKIKDITLFEEEISNLIQIIRSEPEVFNQEEFDNM